MTPTHVATPRHVYKAAFDHVTLTGHKDLFDADDITTNTQGVACRECGEWWVAGVPRPGEGEKWEEGLYRPTIAQRKKYLAVNVAEILKRLSSKWTAWDRVLDPAF
jgi:hypothetical protein